MVIDEYAYAVYNLNIFWMKLSSQEGLLGGLSQIGGERFGHEVTCMSLQYANQQSNITLVFGICPRRVWEPLLTRHLQWFEHQKPDWANFGIFLFYLDSTSDSLPGLFVAECTSRQSEGSITLLVLVTCRCVHFENLEAQGWRIFTKSKKGIKNVKGMKGYRINQSGCGRSQKCATRLDVFPNYTKQISLVRAFSLHLVRLQSNCVFDMFDILWLPVLIVVIHQFITYLDLHLLNLRQAIFRFQVQQGRPFSRASTRFRQTGQWKDPTAKISWWVLFRECFLYFRVQTHPPNLEFPDSKDLTTQIWSKWNAWLIFSFQT